MLRPGNLKQYLDVTIILLCTATVLSGAGMSTAQFKLNLEREYDAGVFDICELIHTQREEQLVLSLNAPDTELLHAIADYPIASLTIMGGDLHLDSLKGMSVYELNLHAVKCVGFESILGALPLRRFHANYMTWTNLNVLAQINTLTDIRIAIPNDSKPINLAPLKRLHKLERLMLFGRWGPDVSCLSETSVKHLGLVDNMSIKDWSPLKNLRLTSLDLSGSAVSNISFVAGMRLESLNISGTRVTEIAALRGMPLKTLRMSGVQVEDLTPLAGMPLEYLVFDVSAARKGLNNLRAMSSSIKLIGTRGDGRSMNTDVTSPDEFWRRFEEKR